MSLTAPLQLCELNQQIATALSDRFASLVWVVAEVATPNTRANGNSYIELVEKRDDMTVAQAAAAIWNSRCGIIAQFEKETRRKFSSGLQVLLQIKVSFHSVYGLRHSILAIDSTYSLGDMARKRLEIVNRRLTDSQTGHLHGDRRQRIPRAMSATSISYQPD